MQRDSIEYVKQLILEEGGYVSCVDPMGPVTVLFFTVRQQTYEQRKGGELIPMKMPRYERMVMEYPLWELDDADELRKYIRKIIEDSNGMEPVFSVYSVNRNLENKLIIRAGFINSIWGGKLTTETTYEEAIELLKNPPDYPHPIHWIDMKTVYKL